MVHYSRSLTVPVSAAELFAWHERPGAFERLSPPWQRVEVVRSDGRITAGARVELRTWLPPGPVGVPVRWHLEHRDYVAGHQFRDVQLVGPFARWSHLHRVDSGPGAGASTLTDAVDYALPLGTLGALGGGAVARAELDRLFRYRHAVTLADLERHAAAALPPMTVAVTGASGLIGRALTHFLTTGGHTVVRVGRASARGETSPPSPQVRDVTWDPAAGRLDPRALDEVDAVVHLAGANVGDRWTPAHRRAIMDSRVQGTRLVARTIAAMARPPRVLVSASAVGYYGDRGDEVLDEGAPRGRGFLADVAAAWEDAADPARAAGIRVVHPRFGVVLTPAGGALPQLLLPFRVGAGGSLGDGRQWTSVIALDDVLGALHAMLARDALAGAVNVVLPHPVRNADFARVLGRVLHRPALVPAPAFALRLLLGREQADEMLLASQRVVPSRLLAAGFVFRHPTLEDALRFELGR
ncbi:oxidoreductase [Gemmatimonadetes bacterium T265]|nr:oxidoreductase [Gemmatimonadetes bacterium T265]